MVETATVKNVRVALFAFDGCMASGIAGPLDVFRTANTLAALRGPVLRPRFETTVVSAGGRPVTTSAGLRIPTRVLRAGECDALIVCGIDHANVGDLLVRVERATAEVAALDRLTAAKPLPAVASTCSGTFLLAEAGLLEGRRATTSWWLGSAFARRYPRVKLEGDALLVEDGPYTSSGGVTSFFDISLRLLERFGDADLAQTCARVMLLDPWRRSQAPYVARALLEEPRSGLIERAERWTNRNLERSVSIEALAAHCAVSPRTLLRRFREETGMAPTAYVRTLRVERAKALLASTRLTLDEITARCGYEDTSAFRKLFKQKACMTPGQYRIRFALPQGR
jgi:transcriptional regulator GlxA family with amidase domain